MPIANRKLFIKNNLDSILLKKRVNNMQAFFLIHFRSILES